jgi:sucrose phosphorylase
MRAKVGLIAYADRFGTDLAGLRGLLNGPLRGLFGGVHVLPFYCAPTWRPAPRR